MKLGIKIGDKVQVTVGKLAGKEAAIVFIDKKNNRVRLEGLKKIKSKGKKGKDLHGTFHVSSLKALPKPEAAAPAVEGEAKA